MSASRIDSWAVDKHLTAADRELLEERAALIEYQGNVSRYVAEGMAIRQWMEGKQ